MLMDGQKRMNERSIDYGHGIRQIVELYMQYLRVKPRRKLSGVRFYQISTVN